MKVEAANLSCHGLDNVPIQEHSRFRGSNANVANHRFDLSDYRLGE
jgi:hypothetical protein